MNRYDCELRTALIEKRARDYKRILNAIKVCENLESINVVSYNTATESRLDVASWGTLRDNGLIKQTKAICVPGSWKKIENPWRTGTILFKAKNGEYASVNDIRVLERILGKERVEEMGFEPLPGYYYHKPGHRAYEYHLCYENIEKIQHIANTFIGSTETLAL